tara:strand:+ start:56 stop:688 length:633 start_codon:yes stop_codon:yes gene_type:complete
MKEKAIKLALAGLYGSVGDRSLSEFVHGMEESTFTKKHLGEDIYSVRMEENEAIELKVELGDTSSLDDYIYLSKDDKFLTQDIYRTGMHGKFKDGYALFIHFGTLDNPIKRYSNWVVVNTKGEIIFRKPEAHSIDSMYLQGGHLVAIGKAYYDLRTGKPILEPHTTISSDEYIFGECLGKSYRHPELKQERGVYKINKHTVEIEFFPEKR